jgi:hypothetical protein
MKRPGAVKGSSAAVAFDSRGSCAPQIDPASIGKQSSLKLRDMDTFRYDQLSKRLLASRQLTPRSAKDVADLGVTLGLAGRMDRLLGVPARSDGPIAFVPGRR